MADELTNIEVIRRSARATNMAVLPGVTGRGLTGGAESPPSEEAGLATAYEQSVAKAVQSIGQTTAIVIQDAADMLRNVSTIEVTAIGAATAAWLATKQTEPYKDIIKESMTMIEKAADAYLKIGKNAYEVLSQFQ